MHEFPFSEFQYRGTSTNHTNPVLCDYVFDKTNQIFVNFLQLIPCGIVESIASTTNNFMDGLLLSKIILEQGTNISKLIYSRLK